mmetsp:Transcript_150163/g.262344  ORF Transcript_150163/g.262344 Transcript_150163/m.262344 type:complete len:793 (-) Transcript_150163:83-2461(-)
MNAEAFQRALDHAAETSQKSPDDEKNMFQYLYEARKELTALKDTVIHLYKDFVDDVPKRRVAQAQLARVSLVIADNMAQCKETTEGKEVLDEAQALLEASRVRQFYSYEAAAAAKAQKAREAREREERNKKLKEEAAKQGINVNTGREAKWLPETAGDLAPVIEEFPIPTVYGDVDYDYVDMLMEVYNRLAMQWSTWQEDIKASLLLKNAIRIYEDWASHCPVKRLQVMDDRHVTAEPVSLQRVVDAFASETAACRELRDAEQQKQNDLLQQRLLKKRLKKGILAGNGAASTNGAHPEPAPEAPPDDTAQVAEMQSAIQKLEQERKEIEDREKCQKDRDELRSKINPEMVAFSRLMDRQYTLTQYALGQVYRNLDKPHDAAECFLRVLTLLLRTKDFDRPQFIQYATDLAMYYIYEYDLPSAEHCLNAAELFVPKDQAGVLPQEVDMNLRLTWGKYWHRLLKLNREVTMAVEADPTFKTNDEVSWIVEGGDSVVVKEKANIPKVHFDRLPIAPPRKSVMLVQNLPQARVLFNKAVEQFEGCVDFYDIDDHTEDRITIMQEISSLYEMITCFEQDPNTKFTLHSKRIRYLTDFLDKLENIIFTNTLRQYRFEIGSTYQAMAEIRLEQTRIRQPMATSEEINTLLHQAVDYFQKFVDSFEEEFRALQKLKQPEERLTEFVLEEDYLAAFILGNCCVAGLTMKTITEDKADQDANIEKAMSKYSLCIDFAKKCKLEKKPDIKPQLVLCKEMLTLLPDAKSEGKFPQPPSHQRLSDGSLFQKTLQPRPRSCQTKKP